MSFSEGALGMLLGKYRKVLKKCKILNILGGGIIAGVLLAGGAQAADWSADTVVVDSVETVTTPREVSNLEIPGGGALTVNMGGAANPDDALIVNNSLNISGGALNIVGGNGIQGGSAPEVNHDFLYTGKVNMDSGTLNITDSILRMQDVKINGGTVNISGIRHDDADHWLNNARIAVNNGDAGGALSISGSGTVINLGSHGTLSGITVNVADATLNLGGPSLDAASLVRAWSGNAVKLDNARLNVAANSFGVIVAPELRMNGGSMDIAGDLTISGALNSTNNGLLSQVLNNTPRGEGAISGGSVDVGGSLHLNNYRLAVEEGASLSNGGTVEITRGGRLDLRNGEYRAEADTKLILNGASNPNQSSTASLRLLPAQLDEALKGSIESNNARIFVYGNVEKDAAIFNAPQAESGKISLRNDGAFFWAQNLKLAGPDITLPNGGMIGGDAIKLDNNVTLGKGSLVVTATGENSSLDIGAGDGTLGLHSAGAKLVVGGSYGNDDTSDTPRIDINGKIELSVNGQLDIVSSQTEQGTYRKPDVYLNNGLSVEYAEVYIGGPNVHLSAGTPENPNTIYVGDEGVFLNHADGLSESGRLYLNEPNTRFIASPNAHLSNWGTIFATTDVFGLKAQGDEWSSKTFEAKFSGNTIRLTGTGSEISKQSFANLRNLLGPEILRVDATVTGAITDGKIMLEDVVPGGLLEGYSAYDAIVEGVGEAGDATILSGNFASLNLTNPAATGVTIGSGDNQGNAHTLYLNGEDPITLVNGNLINTPNGPGNVIVNNGTVWFGNGKINNLALNNGWGGLENVKASAVNLTGSYPSLNIRGNAEVDYITASGNTVTVNGQQYAAAGTLRLNAGTSLLVNGDIGEEGSLLQDIYSLGSITANNIHALYFRAYQQAMTEVSGGLFVSGYLDNRGSLRTGQDVSVSGTLSVADGGEITSAGTITANGLQAANGKITADGAVKINGNASLDASSLVSRNDSVDISGNAGISGNSIISAVSGITIGGVNVATGEAQITTTDGDIDFGARDAVLAENAKLALSAEKGAIKGANISATDITAQSINSTGSVALANGSLKLTGNEGSEIGGTLTLENAEASVNGAKANALEMDGGKLAASGTVALADNSIINNGAQATINTLELANGKSLSVGMVDDAAGQTLLSVDTLKMNGGDLLVDPAWGQPSSNVAVKAFNNTGTAAQDALVDGNIMAGQNSYVTLGTTDASWLPGVARGMGVDGLSEAGPTAALGLYSPIRLRAGKSLTVDGAWQSGQEYARNDGTINFASKSLLVVNGQPENGSVSWASGAQRPADTQAAISAESATTANIADDAKLYVANAEQGKDYLILDPNSITPGNVSETAWSGENVGTDNPLVTLERADLDASGQTGQFGEFRAVAESAVTAMPGLDGELGSAIDAAAAAGQLGVREPFTSEGKRGTQFLSRALVKASPLYGNDPEGAAKTIESAARMAALGGAPQMTLAANSAAGAAVTQRASLAIPGGKQLQVIDETGNPVTDNAWKKGFALWILPLFQSTNGFGMEAGNYDYDFSGSLGGVTIGADYTFEDSLRAGILFNIGGGYLKGGGDLAKTTNNMNFWGLGAYAGWNYENFGLSADVNYTSAFNKIRQDLEDMGNMGELKLDGTSWALSTGLRAEYVFNTEALDIIPHAGFRYTNLTMDDYDVKGGGTVIKGDSFTQNIWTFPLGVAFSKDIPLQNGWSMKPMLDLNITPAAGDIKAKSNIRFTGTDTQAQLKTKIMDYVTYGGTAGIEFGNDSVSVGVNYNGQFGAESSAHAVFGTFRYEF